MYSFMSFILPPVQSTNPLGNSFLFSNQGLDCVVLTNVTKEWENVLPGLLDIDDGKRYLYFPKTRSVWRCQVHINIACVFSCHPETENITKEAETVIKYLTLTAQRASPGYKIANVVGYKIFLYINTPEPLKLLYGTEVREKVTRTVLDEDIGQSREYKYNVIFNERWELPERPAVAASGSGTGTSTVQSIGFLPVPKEQPLDLGWSLPKDEKKVEWATSKQEKGPISWTAPTILIPGQGTTSDSPKNNTWTTSGQTNEQKKQDQRWSAKSDSFTWGTSSPAWYPPGKTETFSWTPNPRDTPKSTFGSDPSSLSSMFTFTPAKTKK